MMEKAVNESQYFRDIIMGNFIDSYYNLTLKSIFVINWYQRRCSHSFLAYLDDDVVINPENLI
jgi:hypothetical protein